MSSTCPRTLSQLKAQRTWTKVKLRDDEMWPTKRKSSEGHKVGLGYVVTLTMDQHRKNRSIRCGELSEYEFFALGLAAAAFDPRGRPLESKAETPHPPKKERMIFLEGNTQVIKSKPIGIKMVYPNL